VRFLCASDIANPPRGGQGWGEGTHRQAVAPRRHRRPETTTLLLPVPQAPEALTRRVPVGRSAASACPQKCASASFSGNGTSECHSATEPISPKQLFFSGAWRSDSPIQCRQLSADNIDPGFEFLSASSLQSSGYLGPLCFLSGEEAGSAGRENAKKSAKNGV
jgi:hypothetical protein